MTPYHFLVSNYTITFRMKCVYAVCCGVLLNSPRRVTWQCTGLAVDEHDMISVAGELNFKIAFAASLVHNSGISAISECLCHIRSTYCTAQNTEHFQL